MSHITFKKWQYPLHLYMAYILIFFFLNQRIPSQSSEIIVFFNSILKLGIPRLSCMRPRSQFYVATTISDVPLVILQAEKEGTIKKLEILEKYT